MPQLGCQRLNLHIMYVFFFIWILINAISNIFIFSRKQSFQFPPLTLWLLLYLTFVIFYSETWYYITHTCITHTCNIPTVINLIMRLGKGFGWPLFLPFNRLAETVAMSVCQVVKWYTSLVYVVSTYLLRAITVFTVW